MPTLFFWNEWIIPYRRIWYGLSGIFIFSLLFMWFSWFQEANGIIHWEKIQEQKIIETTIHTFQAGPFELTVPAESYVIFEYLQGSDTEHNTIASYIFLTILIVCAMMLLTVITTLERFWYFTAMGLFIVFVVSLRLDVLLLFGLQGFIVPISVLIIFVLTSFYFKSIKPETSFSLRFLIFMILASLLGIIIAYFSRIPIPFLHLSITAYPGCIILSVLFIIMVAHEILVSFVYITSQGSSKSLKHFSIISSIYLINVLITCLHETGYLQWDFIYINLYLLLSLSAILGLWGFKLREPLYENIFQFSPVGAFFFLAFASICFITVGQLLGNANDAPLRIIRGIIIFSHTGYGIIFLTYLFSNYFSMMWQNLPVHKILYRPNRMPYFTFRFAGLIATLAFVFYSGWRQYVYQGIAGFYNYVADLYILQGNETFGRSFYEQSRVHAIQSNRANYALATIKASRLDFDGAFYNYDFANDKWPTDFSLVNEGNLHLWQKEYFPAIRTFRQAEKIKPSDALNNNLGFAYAKIHALDSALYYIDAARKHALTKSSAEANFFALIAAEYLPVKTDSILRLFDSDSPAAIGNAVAAATLFNQEFQTDANPLSTTSLDLYSATFLNNYIIRNAKSLDTTFTTHAFKVAADTGNFIFSEALKASLAYAYYHQSNVHKALQILGALSYTSQSYQGKYYYIMGLWAMEQENPGIALRYFTNAAEADYKDAKLYNAIALTEAGRIEEALIAWDSVDAQKDAGEKQMAARLKRILALKSSEALQLRDAEKYQFCRYKVSIYDTANFSRLVNTISNEDYKAQALLDMSKKQFKADRISHAIKIFNQITALNISNEKLFEDIQYFELRMLASRYELQNLATQINKGLTFDSSHKLEKMLYTALLKEASDSEAAKRSYELLSKLNPFYEDGVLAAANFFRKQDPKSNKPYDILAEAIQVNSNSIRLLKAYAAEATRIGFDEYAASALERLMQLEQENR